MFFVHYSVKRMLWHLVLHVWCVLYTATRILSTNFPHREDSFVPCPTFRLKWRTYYYTTALHLAFLSCNSQIRKRLKIHKFIKYGYSVVAGWFHSWHATCAPNTSEEHSDTSRWQLSSVCYVGLATSVNSSLMRRSTYAHTKRINIFLPF